MGTWDPGNYITILTTEEHRSRPEIQILFTNLFSWYRGLKPGTFVDRLALCHRVTSPGLVLIIYYTFLNNSIKNTMN